jgi:hypothetical protein
MQAIDRRYYLHILSTKGWARTSEGKVCLLQVLEEQKAELERALAEQRSAGGREQAEKVEVAEARIQELEDKLAETQEHLASAQQVCWTCALP